jgi:iron complex outermembrane receptor protein/vitamin B12 transporter
MERFAAMTPINPPINARRLAVAYGCCVLGLLESGHALAQATDEPTLSPVIVTGTRIAEERDRVATSTTVVDAETIAVANPPSTVDLLRAVPGVQIVQPGGGAGIVSLYLRGCQPNYVLFLIDGVPANDSNDSRGGSFDVSSVAPDELQRVEVIRGPESAIYGADAMCGVVNFITRPRADRPEAAVEAGAGLRESYETAFTGAGPLLERGGFDVRAGTSDQGALVPGATFGADNFNGKLVIDRDAGYTITMHARYVTTHGSDYPAESGGPDYAVSSARDVRTTRQTGFDLGGAFDLASYATLEAAGSTYHHAVDFASPGVLAPDLSVLVPARGEISDLARDRASLDLRLALPAALRAVVGADYQREQGDLDGYIDVAPGFAVPDSYLLERHTDAVFGEAEYSGFAGVTLSGSLRHDAPSDTESHTTAKLGAVYTPDLGVTEFRAQWGQGFKEPSLWALGNALVGNPNLLTEQSWTSEAGVTRYLDDRLWRLELTAFHNHFVNLVDFDNTLFQFVNRPLVTADGAEFSVGGQLAAGLAASAQLSYVDVDPKDSQIQILQRPRWHGTGEVTWQAGADWTLRGSVVTTAKFDDFSYPAGGNVVLGGYSVANLAARWRASPHVSVRIAVDNVLNRHYYEAYGFAVTGISPRLSVRYQY